MSILDDIEARPHADLSPLVSPESPFLTLTEANMYFTFGFSGTENTTYYLLRFRGMMLDILDVLRASPGVRRASMGDIRLPQSALADAERIFYDRDVFPHPIHVPYYIWLFEVYMDVEPDWRIPGALRVMCPVCQILHSFTKQETRLGLQARLTRTDDPVGNYDFSRDIEYLASLKSRFGHTDYHPEPPAGIIHQLSNWLCLFGIDTGGSPPRPYYFHELMNFLGRRPRPVSH